MTSLLNLVKIKVTEHPYLNTCKGVVYCADLKFLEVEKILNEENTKAQGVIEAKKLFKKYADKEEPSATEVAIITFKRSELPAHLLIAFMSMFDYSFYP